MIRHYMFDEPSHVMMSGEITSRIANLVGRERFMKAYHDSLYNNNHSTVPIFCITEEVIGGIELTGKITELDLHNKSIVFKVHSRRFSEMCRYTGSVPGFIIPHLVMKDQELEIPYFLYVLEMPREEVLPFKHFKYSDYIKDSLIKREVCFYNE